MAHLNDLAAASAAAGHPQGISPQPPIRRHHLAEVDAAAASSYALHQNALGQVPSAYGYVTGQPADMVVTSGAGGLPLPLSQGAIPSPGAASAIYGNFEDAPQGYLDRLVGLLGEM